MLITNNAEGGSDGTTPTTSDTGSGNAFDTIFGVTATNTITYSAAQAAHGSLSYMFSQDTSNTGLYVQWNATTLGTNTECYVRFTTYYTATPSVSQRFVRGRTTVPAQGWALNLGSTGKLFMKNSADTTIWQSTSILPANQWFRVEAHIVHNGSSGTLQAQYFTSLDSSSPTEDSGVITDDFGANTASLSVGPVNATQMPLYYIDDVAFADVSNGWIGPVAPSNGNFNSSWLQF